MANQNKLEVVLQELTDTEAYIAKLKIQYPGVKNYYPFSESELDDQEKLIILPTIKEILHQHKISQKVNIYSVEGSSLSDIKNFAIGDPDLILQLISSKKTHLVAQQNLRIHTVPISELNFNELQELAFEFLDNLEKRKANKKLTK